MLEGITNTVVMVSFGLFIGILISLFGMLGGLYDRPEKRQLNLKKRAQESPRDYFRRLKAESDERAERNIKEMATWPRSLKIVYASLIVFVLILVLILNFTPIRMNWLAFLTSMFATGVTGALIYDNTRKGKI